MDFFFFVPAKSWPALSTRSAILIYLSLSDCAACGKNECIWKCASRKNKNKWNFAPIRKRTYVSAAFLLRSRWCTRPRRVYCARPGERYKWWRASGPSEGTLLSAQSWCVSVGAKEKHSDFAPPLRFKGISAARHAKLLMLFDLLKMTRHRYLFLVIPLPVHEFISCDLIFLASLRRGYPWK